MSRHLVVGWLLWVNFGQMYTYGCVLLAPDLGKAGERSSDAWSSDAVKRVDVPSVALSTRNACVVLENLTSIASVWKDCLDVLLAVVVQIAT